MPYIENERRTRLDRIPLEVLVPETEGELNYCLTVLLLNWIGESANYAAYNAAMGALECAKFELYRRLISRYEDAKILQNGDVYA